MHGRTLLASLSLTVATMANAQLWTATDIQGVSHTLQDHLDEGRAVLVDVSAHWCGPCWSLHNSHALEKLYQEFGPNGTNDLMVFWIDGSWDPPSSMTLLNGGAGSQGNWIAGTSYPIFGPDGQGLDLIETYLGSATSYSFPTLYRYCPGAASATSFGVSSSTTWLTLYQNLRNGCSAAFTNGSNDATLLGADDLKLCPGQAPTVYLHNMGTSPLSSATITMMDGSEVLSTFDWTGNLARWATTAIEFPDVDISSATALRAVVSQPNGQPDDHPQGDSQEYPYVMAPEAQMSTVRFQLRTDSWANETKWKLFNSSNQMIYQDPPGNYANNTTYEYWWELNPNDCYRLEVTDSYGDGLLGQGFYKLFSGGNVFAQGGSFGTLDKVPFKTGTAVGVVENTLDRGLAVYPNPSTGRVNVDLDLPAAARVSFTVTNILGAQAHQSTMAMAAGAVTTVLDLADLAQGTYTLSILADGMIATRKITITH